MSKDMVIFFVVLIVAGSFINYINDVLKEMDKQSIRSNARAIRRFFKGKE